MNIAIIAAMHEECTFFRKKLGSNQAYSHLNMKVDVASCDGHKVILIESGIGKVNATLAAQHVIDQFEVDLVINTGSAGGIAQGAAIGDFVIADRVCHHDIDISPIGFAYGELPQLPVYYKTHSSFSKKLLTICQQMALKAHTGPIATGDSFVYQDTQLATIKQRFDGVIACEMEAAAVAQVCHLYQKDFIMIRNLSDMADEHAPINFQDYVIQAGKKTSRLLFEFIKNI